MTSPLTINRSLHSYKISFEEDSRSSASTTDLEGFIASYLAEHNLSLEQLHALKGEIKKATTVTLKSVVLNQKPDASLHLVNEKIKQLNPLNFRDAIILMTNLRNLPYNRSTGRWLYLLFEEALDEARQDPVNSSHAQCLRDATYRRLLTLIQERKIYKEKITPDVFKLYLRSTPPHLPEHSNACALSKCYREKSWQEEEEKELIICHLTEAYEAKVLKRLNIFFASFTCEVLFNRLIPKSV